MSAFRIPEDLIYNTAAITDPERFAEEAGAAGWLYLCGSEFESMENGMSYDQVQAAVAESENIITDPPRVLSVELARQHVDALDRLPRPTLVTCRTGPRASAVVYLYAGLKSGASAEEVLARADADGAPFTTFDDYRSFLAEAIAELGGETTSN